MEFDGGRYFVFWSYLGAFSLIGGILALENADYPASVSPATLFLSKVFFVTAAFYSSTYASIILPYCSTMCRRCVMRRCLIVHIISFALSQFSFFVERIDDLFAFRYKNRDIGRLCLLWYLINHFRFGFPQPQHLMDIGPVKIFLYTTMSMLHLSSSSILLRTAVFIPSLCTLLVRAIYTCREDPLLQRWLPVVAENGIFSKVIRMMNNNRELIAYSIWGLVTIHFHWFFPLTSVVQVVPFIFFTVAWLANLALLLGPNDLGIFEFLLGNVVFTNYRLHSTTWILYALSIPFYHVKSELTKGGYVVARASGEGNVAFIAFGVNPQIGENLPETFLNVDACHHSAILERDIIHAKFITAGFIQFLCFWSLVDLAALLVKWWNPLWLEGLPISDV